MLEREANGIQSAVEAVFSKGVDFKMIGSAFRSEHALSSEIHGELIAVMRPDAFEQGLNFRSLQHHRQHAVLKAIVVEDVGEGRGKNAAKALVEQGPGRVLA